MARSLDQKTFAMLVADGFEQVELERPMHALREAGATAVLVAPESDQVHGWQHDHWGDAFPVDAALDTVAADQFDGLLLPGGVMNPDHLRENPDAVAFARAFFDQQKPVASICHGPWLLVEADVVDGRTMTSYNSIKTDVVNAGANWVDRDAVVDDNLVTSRNPGDLDAFCPAMVDLFAERAPQKQTTSSQDAPTMQQAPGISDTDERPRP